MPEPTATPLSQAVELQLTGHPDAKNKYGSGHIRPHRVFFYYLPDRTSAHLYGSWVREDGELTDDPVDQLYRHDDTWPDWLAELARQHTPPDQAAALSQALEAQAAGDALTEFAEMLSARIPEGSPTEDHEDVIGVILELREEANQNQMQAASLRRAVGEEPEDSAPDTLPTWLHQRFDPRGPDWEQLSDDDRTYWEHHARAVRRAVARNGFKEA